MKFLFMSCFIDHNSQCFNFREINLSYNNISEVPANVWPSMNALLVLDLSYNPLGDGLYSESFRSLLTLRTIVLTGTSIKKPPWEALSTLSSLQYLKLNVGFNI